MCFENSAGVSSGYRATNGNEGGKTQGDEAMYQWQVVVRFELEVESANSMTSCLLPDTISVCNVQCASRYEVYVHVPSTRSRPIESRGGERLTARTRALQLANACGAGASTLPKIQPTIVP